MDSGSSLPMSGFSTTKSQTPYPEIDAELRRWEGLLAEDGAPRWESFTASARPPPPPPSTHSLNEQVQSTVERLIDKNVQLAEELESVRSRSSSEVSSLSDALLKQKAVADAAQEDLKNLRKQLGQYLSLPSHVKERTKEENRFWDELATPGLLKSSTVPPWFAGDAITSAAGGAKSGVTDVDDFADLRSSAAAAAAAVVVVPAKVALPLSVLEASNFRAAYQRLSLSHDAQRSELDRLRKYVDDRRPVVRRLAETATAMQAKHKRDLSAAVRRIENLVEDRDKLEVKCDELSRYVAKLETKALANRGPDKVRNNRQPSAGKQADVPPGPVSRSVPSSTRSSSSDVAGAHQRGRTAAATTTTRTAGGLMSAGMAFAPLREKRGDAARAYAAASESSRQKCMAGLGRDLRTNGGGGNNNDENDEDDDGGGGGGGGGDTNVKMDVTEGRRKMALAQSRGGRRNRAARGDGSDDDDDGRSRSPAALERALLDSIVQERLGMDEEEDEETERMQKEFASFYGRGGASGKKAATASSREEDS